MNRLWPLLAFAVAVPVVVWAADPFDRETASVVILQSRVVQRELGVSAEQRAELNKQADWYNSETQKLQRAYAAQAEGKETPPPPPTSEIEALSVEMKQRVLRLLDSQQIIRLRELSLQSAGNAGLLNDAVAKQVGLTDAQLGLLRDTFQANDRDARAAERRVVEPILEKYRAKDPASEAEAQRLMQEADKEIANAREGIVPEVKRLVEEFEAKVEATLTLPQKLTFRMLQGAEFDPPDAEPR